MSKPKSTKKRSASPASATTSSSSTSSTTSIGSSDTKYLRDADFVIHEVQVRKGVSDDFDAFCLKCHDEGYWFCIAATCGEWDYATKEEYTKQQAGATDDEGSPSEKKKKKKKPNFSSVEEAKEQMIKWFRWVDSIRHLAFKESQERGRTSIILKGWEDADLVVSGLPTGTAGTRIGMMSISVNLPPRSRGISSSYLCSISGCERYPMQECVCIGLKETFCNGVLSDQIHCELDIPNSLLIPDRHCPHDHFKLCEHHAEMAIRLNIEYNNAYPPLASLVEKERQKGAFMIMKLMVQRDRSMITSGIIFDLPDDLLLIITSYLIQN